MLEKAHQIESFWVEIFLIVLEKILIRADHPTSIFLKPNLISRSNNKFREKKEGCNHTMLFQGEEGRILAEIL